MTEDDLIMNYGRASIHLMPRRPIRAGLSRGGIPGLPFRDQLHPSCVCWNPCLLLIFTHRFPTSLNSCLARLSMNPTILPLAPCYHQCSPFFSYMEPSHKG